MTDETLVEAPIVNEQAVDAFIEQRYLDYAKETVANRAVPDAGDGMKPVQRRILWAMFDTGMKHTATYKKSARVVGEVLGKYHPHGDQSVYDAMVHLGQSWAMRVPLIDGQGNFGSIDGDPPAAMRYTEARLSSTADLMLMDLAEDTADWTPNFDESLKEPVVLPTRFPNLLVNGTNGIAVALATTIPPHNLGEICNGIILVAKDWSHRNRLTYRDLKSIVLGPDFPTGGILYRCRVNGDGDSKDMIEKAYLEGRSTLVCQAKADIQDIGGGKSEIIISEIPFQVNKSTILERVGVLSREGNLPGLMDARDESDYKGMRIVFEVGRGTDPNEVLDKLFTYTELRSSMTYNSLALVETDGGHRKPKLMTLVDMIAYFIELRLKVITLRSKSQLKKAKDRLNVIEGYLKALSAIDEVVQIIRSSKDTDAAKTRLMKDLGINDVQAQSILEMPLRRLTSLERTKLDDEKKELDSKIAQLSKILDSESERLKVVIEETTQIRDSYSDKRRTVIVNDTEGHTAKVTATILDTPTDDQVVTVSANSIQRYSLSEYKDSVQEKKFPSRGSDFPLFKVNIKPGQKLVLFSNAGRTWSAGLAKVPSGIALSDLGMNKGERIVGAGALTNGEKMILVTRSGCIKRVEAAEFFAAKSEGAWVNAIGFASNNDELAFAALGSDEDNIVIFTAGSTKSPAKSLHFNLGEINPQATPSAKGVGAINLESDKVATCAVIPGGKDDDFILLGTEKGFIKRLAISDLPQTKRGGGGVIVQKVTDATGSVTGSCHARKGEKVDVILAGNKRTRMKVDEIAPAGRAAKATSLAEYVEAAKGADILILGFRQVES